jgi:hypothetical protein
LGGRGSFTMGGESRPVLGSSRRAVQADAPGQKSPMNATEFGSFVRLIASASPARNPSGGGPRRGRCHGLPSGSQSGQVFSRAVLCHLCGAQRPIAACGRLARVRRLTGWNDCNFVALGD